MGHIGKEELTQDVADILDNIGDTSVLTTTAKEDLVVAVNEVKAAADAAKTAADQAKQSGDSVKSSLVDKLISLGQSASTSETFEVLLGKLDAVKSQMAHIPFGGVYYGVKYSSARSCTMASSGDNVYRFGGHTSGSSYAGSYKLSMNGNVFTNTWTAIADFPVKHTRMCSVTLPNGNILVHGGATSGSATPSTSSNGSEKGWIYNVIDNTYSPISNSPQIARDHSAILINNEVFFVGGYDGDVLYNNNLMKYNISTDTWTKLTSKTQRSWRMGLAHYNGCIFALGAQFEKYDLNTGTWTNLNSDVERNGPAFIYSKGRIFVLYGNKGNSSWPTGGRYMNLSTLTWTGIVDDPSGSTIDNTSYCEYKGNLIMTGGDYRDTNYADFGKGYIPPA